MREVEVSSLGGVVYWALPDTEVPHERLVEVWKNHGLPENLLPQPPRPSKALRRAVSDLKSARRLARPLKRGSSWALVDETVHGDRDLEHKVATRARLVRDPASGRTRVATDGNGLGQQIVEGFERQKGLQRSHDISMLLIRSAFSCGALTLRDHGGVYFIPIEGLAFWTKVAAAVESLVPGAGVYRLETQINEASVRAVLNALKSEADDEMRRLRDELQAEGDDALGPRALRSRIAKVDGLKAKVAGYEGLLSHSLPDLQSNLTRLRSAVVEAEAVASAEDDDRQTDMGQGF